MSSRFTVPESDFLELASGGGSPAVIKRLHDGEYTRRLVMLRAFMEAANGDPAASADPTISIARAWSALEDAERRDPATVSAILAHPQVGSYLAYVIRRHRGGAASPAPIQHDFCQINTVALVAAAAARQPFRASIPLRGGRVILPRLGMARFDGCAQWDVADATTKDGRIQIQHGDQVVTVPVDRTEVPGWWPLRRITVGDQLRLTVLLDDLDPMRDLADPLEPARLSMSDVRRWTDLLEGAWRILVDHHRPLAEAIAVGVTSLVPLPVGDGWNTRSASTGDAWGAILCSPPPDAVTLAVSLAHEFAHIKLGGLMHLFTMTNGAGERRLYAPWRDDPRPAGGLLQGIYAFFAISAFWRRQRSIQNDTIGDFEYMYARGQTLEALDIALRDGDLSDRGRRFAETVRDTMNDWRDSDVDRSAADLARLVADGHRAGWRIRHCLPRAADVDALATAWDSDSHEPVEIGPSEVMPDSQMRHWSAGRLGLARRRLLSPEQFTEARYEDWGASLTDADLSLFGGEPAKAVAGFLEEIAGDTDSVDAWTGLGVALCFDTSTNTRAGAALMSRPEVVVAVHRRSRSARSPVDLAAWIGGRLESNSQMTD